MCSICEIETHQDSRGAIRVFELTHASGCKAVLSNYGCVLMKLLVQDKTSMYRDVVLGFDSITSYWQKDYLKGYPYFGTVLGRYANRIKGASFIYEGKKYNLTANKDGNTLHGGAQGFDQKVWEVVAIKNEADPSITFQYVSPAGEEGFPGKITVQFTATLSSNAFTYQLTATTDAPSPVNLSYHPYFNLDGYAAVIGQQQAIIHASHWLEQDEDFCLTGRFLPTASSHYDFGTWKPICQSWNQQDGYDQSFVVDQNDKTSTIVAEAISSDKNLHLKVISTEPVVHFYTGKWIPRIVGKSLVQYGPFSGYCFETHQFPNAINIVSFPSTILLPHQEIMHRTTYQF